MATKTYYTLYTLYDPKSVTMLDEESSHCPRCGGVLVGVLWNNYRQQICLWGPKFRIFPSGRDLRQMKVNFCTSGHRWGVWTS